MRRVAMRLAAAAAAAMGLVWLAPPASAHTAGDHAVADATVPDQVTGGTVTQPDGTTRPLNRDAAETFVRSWLRAAIGGQLAHEEPPAEVAAAHVDVALMTAEGQAKHMQVLFVTKGDAAWVAMPPQNLGWAVVDRQVWMRAPAASIKAFNGVGVPDPAGTSAAAPATARRNPGGDPHTGRFVLLSALCIAGAVVLVVELRGRAVRPVTH